MNPDILITRTSNRSLEDVCARLPEISQQNRFGVLGLHNLKEKMMSKGVAFDRECRVFEVCNPQQAKAILTKSMQVSTALPCRISVYEENGKVMLATIKPTAFLSLYNVADAEAIAQEVETCLVRIIEQTAGA